MKYTKLQAIVELVEEAKVRRRKLIRDGAIIAVSIAIAIAIHQFNYIEQLIEFTSGLYFFIAAFIAGFFFATTFTVAIAVSIFLILAQTHNPLLLAAIGGMGALLGDSFIFKFLREDLIADFEYLEGHFGKRIAKRILHSKLIIWFAPLVAAIMIASPIPDEIGLILLAGIKLKYHQFFIISFFLNTIGIFILALFGRFT